MYTRHDLTDAEDELVVPRLPPERSGRRGRPYKSHRSVLCAIASILATGGPWRNLPQEVFGPWKTIYNGYRRWGTERLFETFARAMLWDLDAKGRLHRDLFCIDATITRAHQSAAGALAPRTIPTSQPITLWDIRKEALEPKSTCWPTKPVACWPLR